MTREEKQKAIDALKISAPVMAVTQEEFENYIQTLNKIMDWLEHEPTGSNNLSSGTRKNSKKLESISTTKENLGVDAVSRQAINEYIDFILNNGMGKKKSFDFIKKFVQNMPSVTSIRPKGHWIESDYGNMITQHRWYCSECGGMHNDTESGEWREVFDFKYDYCPLCGADMREAEE